MLFPADMLYVIFDGRYMTIAERNAFISSSTAQQNAFISSSSAVVNNVNINTKKTLRVPEMTMNEIPDAATRAGKILTFDYAGNPQVTVPPTLTLVYTSGATPQDTVVTSGALEADTYLNLCAANNIGARPTLFVKTDESGFTWNITDPANGFSFVVDVQYQVIRLIPLPNENIWVKQ